MIHPAGLAGTPVAVEQFHIVRCDEHGRGVAHWASVGDLPAILGAPA